MYQPKTQHDDAPKLSQEMSPGSPSHMSFIHTLLPFIVCLGLEARHEVERSHIRLDCRRGKTGGNVQQTQDEEVAIWCYPGMRGFPPSRHVRGKALCKGCRCVRINQHRFNAEVMLTLASLTPTEGNFPNMHLNILYW